ncbi:MAG: hypothetical protein HQL69_06225 [Magnetococcales bacterium]|nr:hypothetical protein [Magnetococcales bacterium]
MGENNILENRLEIVNEELEKILDDKKYTMAKKKSKEGKVNAQNKINKCKDILKNIEDEIIVKGDSNILRYTRNLIEEVKRNNG